MSSHSSHSTDIQPYDHVQGSPEAPIRLIEYGDFQCPDCGEAYPIVKQLQQTLGEQMCFVYRHFPLVQIHRHAEMAAEAAEAAAAQDRFWEMHGYLFENQRALGSSILEAGAEDLGLDTERVIADVNSHSYHDRIQRDIASGEDAGVHGTPTFFINGVRHQGAYDFESLMEAIREHRRRAAA